MILDKVNCPDDIKKLSLEEMETLAGEMRKFIINRVNILGGHLGGDLGIVETTIALHYVFNSPKDKFVFDVSHQCYPHKMITGRKCAFIEPEKHPEISGYFNPNESEHDTFVIGHTSTSVSLACGLAKARDLKEEKYNVIALIGDGSLSGGEAFEGLDNAATLDSNFIVIVNDNEMSIAKNQGGLYKNLEELRATNGKCDNNYFKSLGFDYIYHENGNNIADTIKLFEKVKDINHPIVLHIHTQKGLGYEPAEKDKETYHWHTPNFLNPDTNYKEQETYDSITTDYLLNLKEKDKTVIAINPATPGAVGFTKEFREKMGKNYNDPGIAEEHAIAYASGLAKNGCKPVLAVLSSFIQRTYDQLSQDLALNNSPITLLIYWGGMSSADMTHLGVFDIPLISNIPNIVYLAPTNKEEYLKMLDWSVNQTQYSVAIRVPFADITYAETEDNTDYSILNKYKIVEQGNTIALIGVGNFFELAKRIKCKLLKEHNINATLINPRFLTGVDENLLNDLKKSHKLVATFESGILDGGFGEKISRFYGTSNVKVLNFGAKKEFTDRISMEELFEKNNLSDNLIIKNIIENL